MVSRNLERANENDGFKMTALEGLIKHRDYLCVEFHLNNGRARVYNRPYKPKARFKNNFPAISIVHDCIVECNAFKSVVCRICL